mgnify:CR=1 FL=1
MSYLILVRHGESEWNKTGTWTGLTDIGLSEIGREEARQAAEKLKDISIDQAYTSVLSRAKETCTIMLDALSKKDVKITGDKALNERDYGDFTGKNKWQIQQEVGEEQFLKIRRSYNFQIPNGESLKQVYERVLPYYQQVILPKLKVGKNILISAHGNSLRALIKYLENVSDTDIPNVEIKTGQIYLYKIGANGTVSNKQIR